MIKRLLNLRNTFASLAVLLVLLVSSDGFGQGTFGTPIFSEDFGSIANNIALTTSNTTFSYVRVGTTSNSNAWLNQIVAKTPSSFTGSAMIIGAKGTSISTIDKTGLALFNKGAFTFKFKTPSSLSSAILVGAVGNGSSFASASGFTGGHLSAAFQVNGTNLQIRAAGAWTTVQTVTASTNYTVSIIFNNSGGSLSYGNGETLANNKVHIYVNGTKMGEYNAATNSLAATAFRIYTTTAEFEVDDIAVYKELPTSSATSYTVTFDKNHANATGTMANQTASEPTELTENTFDRTNYIFIGWNTAADGNGTPYADKEEYDFTANTTLYAQWTPVTTSLANNGTPVAAGNITQGTNNNILGSFTLAQNGANSTLTSASFLIDGNFVDGDVSANGIKLYTSDTNNFATATLLGSVSVSEPDVVNFAGLTQTLTKDATRYFWVTVDVPVTATVGNEINLYQMNFADLVVSTGTISGSTTVSGTKTVVATVVPTLSVSETILPNFDDVCITTDSSIQSYTLTGLNLTGDITVTAPAGFKIRKGAETFSSSTIVTPVSGATSTNIDVIYSPTVAGASGTLSISHVSTGATTKNVSVSGTGTTGTVAVTTQTISTVSTTAAESGGTTISTSCGTITAKGVVWGTAANPTIALSTKTNDGTGVGDYSSSITGLTENTLYNVRAYATNSHAVTSYGNNLTFTTLSKAPTAPIATTATVNGFTASWTAPAGQGAAAITYTVKIYSNNTLTTQVGSAITGITGTSTVITSLSQSTTYYYTVEAVNTTGSSAVANFTSGITTLSGPCLSEDFVNFSDWTASNTNISTLNTQYGLASPAKALASSSNIISPILNNPKSLSFYQDASSGGNGNTATISYKIGAGEWTLCYSFEVSTTGSTKVVDLTNIAGVDLSAFSNVQLRFESSFNTWYLDDVVIYCGIPCAAPTVTLQVPSVSDITTETVSLHGNVTAQGDFAINTRGFEYSVNSTMSAAATKSSAATTTGTYSENLAGLTANTVYYYRALAINDCSPNKTGYSQTSAYPTFTTLHNAPAVGTGTGATSSSFIAQWSAPSGGGSAAFTYEIQVDDDSNFSSVNFTANGITGITTLVNTGLTPSTTYYYRVRAVNAGGNSAWSATSVGYSTTAPAPEINIKQGSTSIASASSFDIGNQISGTTGSAITFTIENTGNAPLSVGALSKSGADAALFTITQPLSASVAASGTTTFTVTFAPTTMGGKTAQLSLVNGDDDENPYLINLSGTGTANATSDIITDNTFTYATDIDYKNYITADITALNSVELGRFIIRDGGTGDADNVGTTLNSLSISVANADNLERLAIYDGDTKLAEMPALATTNFTGFSLSAADNGTKTFTIRGSFKTIVTDKQRITLTLSSATASETGSGFTTINATTSTTGSNNTINVTADRLAFTTQPIDTGINTAMANVVVSSVDINNNKDIDATGEISITSTGTLTVTPLTANLVNGSATFNNIIHNVAQSARNLIASISGFSDLNSNLFNITEIIYANGDFMTKTGGTWTNNSNGTATWYKRVSGAWSDTTGQIPNGTSGTYTVYITENIEIPDAGVTQLATSKIYITNNKTLTYKWSSNQWTFQNIIIDNGATLKLEGSGRFTMASEGNLEVLNGGTFNYSNTSLNGSSGTIASSLWKGKEIFHPNSNLVIGNHQTGSGNYFLPAAADLETYTENGITAYFGNLIFDANVQDIRLTANNLSSSTTYLTAGNFEIRPYSNSPGTQNLFYGGGTWLIGKNLIIGANSTSSISSSTVVLKASTNTNNVTINVKGDVINLSSNTLNLANSTSGAMTLNLEGDLNIGTTGKLISIANSNPSFNFAGTGDGLTESSTQTINITNNITSSNIIFRVNSGSYTKLINQNLVLGTNSEFKVLNGGTFDFGFSETTPLIITGTTFEAQANSKLKITSPDGIATSGATGNVQTTNRTFGLADYQYTGITNQITGTGLPTSGAKITSANTGTAPNNEVLLTNASTTVSALDIKNGVFNLNEKALTGTNLSIAENTTLKIVGTQSFPSFTNKTFHNNGIVEYGGANQSIAALTNPAYTKLKISGTGTKVLSGTTVEATNSLAITSSLLEISEGQTLRIQNEITTIDTDANNGLFIKNGGSLIQTTEVNNQTTNANVGKIKMERITKPMYRLDYTYWSAPVSENTLIALSPNSPANKFFHWNPNAVSPAPNWAVITGGTAQMLPGKGYIIRAPTVGNGTDATNPASYAAFNGYFNGKPNNGTVTTQVSGPEKWNLIGNPYPSALDAEKFLDDNATLDGTLYFWTHNTPLTGASGYGYSAEDYAAWNGTGSLATVEAPSDSDPADNKPKGFIAAGQSFFVKGLTNGNAVFTNSMRENANNMQFFKSENTEKHRVWLNLKGAEKGFSQTLVGYISNATNGQDHRYDGETFGGNAVAFYSVMENKKWSIQGRALPFVATDEVPLGYKTTLTGTLIINIDDRDGQLATQNIYLKDNLLNVVHNLTDSPYSFTSTPGTFDDRFVLRYLPGENLDNPTFEDQMDGLTIRKNNTDIYINSSFENIDAVLIYDIMGRLLFEKEKCNTTSFKATNLTQSEQMLIVKVRLNNGGVVTKKVW